MGVGSVILGVIAGFAGAIGVLVVSANGPSQVGHPVPAAGAWVWTPKTASAALVPYATPLSMPRVEREEGGAVMLCDDDVKGDGPSLRFDGARFVPGTVVAWEAGINGSRIAGNGWISAGLEKGSKARLFHGVPSYQVNWKPGPTFPDDYVMESFVAGQGPMRFNGATLEDGRIVVPCRKAGGGSLALCVARDHDATFRAVPLPVLPILQVRGMAAGPGSLLLVLGFDGSAKLAPSLVDVDSLVVTPMPFPGPLAAKPLRSLDVAPLNDGRSIITAVNATENKSWELRGWPIYVAVLGLLVAAAIARRTLSKAIAWRSFGAGVLAGAALFGVGIALINWLLQGVHM